MSKWGPRGLETPTSYVGVVKLAAVTLVFASAIGIAQCRKHYGWTDPMTGARSCGDAPSEIEAWSRSHHTRRPEQRADLEKWVARHPDSVNRQYGAFCQTPLHKAARFGREDLAAVLVAAGADVEAPDEHGDRPMHAAATYGQPGVVKVLLDLGASVDARGSGGKTPLQCAAFGPGGDPASRLEVAKLLLSRGADVNATQPGSGYTPLRYAADSPGNGGTAMTDLLLEWGAKAAAGAR